MIYNNNDKSYNQYTWIGYNQYTSDNTDLQKLLLFVLFFPQLITSDADYTLQALNSQDYEEWLNAIQVSFQYLFSPNFIVKVSTLVSRTN